MSEPRRFRNSQLRMLRSCRWAYAEEYLRGTLGSPSPTLQAGSNVHEAIRLALTSLVEQEKKKGLVFLDVQNLAYQAVQGGNVLYADAVEVLTRFSESLIEQELEIDFRNAFLVEEVLTMPLTLLSGEEVVFRGTADLAERTGARSCRITDWKTHRHPETQDEFEADSQLKRYALLVSHEFPAFEEFELVKRFVRYRNNYRTMTVTRDQLEAIRWELISEIGAAREIEDRGDFQATGGDWCGVCAFHHTCPLIQKYRDAGEDLLSIPDDDRATELAGAAIALDAASDNLKNRLKAYLGHTHTSGVVPVAGGEFGYGPTTSREVPLAPLRAAFDEHGAELPEDVLKVDLKALDRLAKRLPDSLTGAIEQVTITTESTRCQFRKGSKKKPAAAAASTPTPAYAGEPELL